MITFTDWAVLEAQREVTEDDLLILTPYKNTVTIMLKYGTILVNAKHDGTDEGGDIDTLKTLCLFRFNQGEQS